MRLDGLQASDQPFDIRDAEQADDKRKTGPIDPALVLEQVPHFDCVSIGFGRQGPQFALVLDAATLGVEQGR